MKTIRLATRGSRLALVQAHQVKARLEALGTTDHPIRVELLEIVTKGDRDRVNPLTAIGGGGLFVRGIEAALLNGTADIAVHSAKDLPYELADGLMIGGVPEAADLRDLLISRTESPVLIGTGSPRRRTELLRQIPGARFAENRGNITTRLRKLQEGQFDAIVLAKAGVDRLGLDLSPFQVRIFSPEEVIPAPCQGILAVECRKEDREIRELLERISDPASLRRFTIERYLFTGLQADCSMAVGVSAQIMAGEETLMLQAMFGGRRGSKYGPATEYQALCDALVSELKER